MRRLELDKGKGQGKPESHLLQAQPLQARDLWVEGFLFWFTFVKHLSVRPSEWRSCVCAVCLHGPCGNSKAMIGQDGILLHINHPFLFS